MSWVTVIWSMIIAACMTIAALNLVIWVGRRASVDRLLLALTAIATSFIAAFELSMMRAETAADLIQALKLAHIPVLVLMICLVAFVRIHLRAGRIWLGWSVIVTRSLAVLINFGLDAGINFREVPALQQVSFLWERVAVAEGLPHPLLLLAQFSLLLLVAFTVDATYAVWRRGERQKAVILGGSICLFVSLGTAQGILIYWGLVQTPVTVSWFYMGIVVAAGYVMSRDVRHAAEHFRLAVEASPSGMVMTDRRGNITLLNTHAEELFGYPRNEVLGASLARLVPERAASVEPAGRHKDGRQFPVEVVRNPISTADGPAMLVSITDITLRRQAEAETARQRAQLTHLSRVNMMGELSGSLAHELMQPLTSILFNAEAALSLLGRAEVPTGQLREALEEIVVSNRLAGDVVGRLRAMIKKEQVMHGPLDINAVVLDVVKLIRSDLSARNVKLESDLAAGLPAVTGDPVQLQQVLLNLTMNGCDAMETCAPADRILTIRTAASAPDQIEVSVVDRGEGIPPESIERIFEAFVTSKAKGMGLGLAVCRTLVSEHRGKLWATNNVDRGATVRFTLPVRT